MKRYSIDILFNYNYTNVVRFHDETRIYLILEFAPEGELYGHLTKLGKFDEKTAANYILQLCAALQHCHQNNVSYWSLISLAYLSRYAFQQILHYISHFSLGDPSFMPKLSISSLFPMGWGDP